MTRNTRRHKTIAYDADGNRTVKEHGGGEAVWVNSKHAGTTTDTVTYSIYPNPYFSVSGNRWTAHYYIGGERFASKAGTLSDFNVLNDPNNDAAGHGIADVNYDNMCQAEEDSIDSIYNQFGVPYEAHHTSTRGKRWHLYLPATREDAGNDGNETADNSEKGQLRNNPIALGDGQMYYYHRDHLGSTMSVTDSLGNIVQLVEYTPWGEVFVERRFGTSGFDTPYLFNGKELDEETGLYYYGARYYDPKMSVWYSTDPMEEKYPWVSTYCHTMNNPNLFIDKEGRYILFIGGLRLTKGNADQIPLFGGFKIHSTDVYHYWSSDKNTFGRKVNIADYYQKVYNDYNIGFTSGSSHWNSTAFDRYMQGKDKAKLFHKMVMSGKIKLSEGEPIRIISHSQGAAHAIGFANQLMSYKNSKGESLYTIDYMEYITPHQPTDLVHPSGPIGIQYSHPSDAIASDSPSWLPNGGTSFGRIINISQFYGDDIMGGKNQPKAEGPMGNMGGHKVTDNDEYIKKGQR